MNLNKKFLAIAMVVAMVFTFLGGLENIAVPTVGTGEVYASVSMPSTTSVTSGDTVSWKASGTDTLVDRLYKFASTLSWIVLGVAVVMIVYAGFKYATSQGDPKATESAKMQIVSAGIGIAIAMMAFVILKIFASISGLST